MLSIGYFPFNQKFQKKFKMGTGDMDISGTFPETKWLDCLLFKESSSNKELSQLQVEENQVVQKFSIRNF